MTLRERLLTVVQGGQPDQTPTIGGDVLLVPLDRLASTLKDNPDQAVLVLIPSPLTLARRKNLDLFAQLQQDPVAGNQTLDELCLSVQIQINDALGAGADGICYIIDGAYPTASTPMQYGGFFLERDRELLENAAKGQFNLLLIAGSQEPYIDFVSDLPAPIFAWDAASGWTAAQVRELRPNGALAAESPEANIQFPTGALQAALDPQEADAKP